ncbi:MAG: flagellar motor switch protein FliN/FliY [Phenylobacterium sp.]|jgi:flagellar motor switch protein FliN/FliY
MSNINEVELSEIEREVADQPENDPKPLIDSNNIALISNLPVNLNVELGQLVMSVEQLYDLKVGEVVKLDTQVNQPIKLCFNQQLVAEGLLVAVDDHYGFEITALAEITA